MKDEILYIWLQQAVGIYSRLPSEIFPRFKNISEIYECNDFYFLGEKRERYISRPAVENQSELVEETKEEADREHIVTDLTPQREKTFTLDVSSQTLQMLAEAVAKKISDDIARSDLATKLIEAGGYKKDNEILAKQVQELLEHNKELTTRIEQLESHSSKRFWKRFWGQ